MVVENARADCSWEKRVVDWIFTDCWSKRDDEQSGAVLRLKPLEVRRRLRAAREDIAALEERWKLCCERVVGETIVASTVLPVAVDQDEASTTN
jgi:hypothetical protein